jgi:hypothetical protein
MTLRSKVIADRGEGVQPLGAAVGFPRGLGFTISAGSGLLRDKSPVGSTGGG